MNDDNRDDIRTVINVIDEFDYSTQTDDYNDEFKKWRRTKNNRFAFSFQTNKNEKVYIDGKGFVANSALDDEKEVLTRIFGVIGMAGLLWMLSYHIIAKLGIAAFTLLGFDIHNDFFSSTIYGGSTEIAAALIAVPLIQIIIPLLYVHFRFRLPGKVEFMSHLHNNFAMFGAIAMTLIICTAVALPTAYSSDSKEVYDYFTSINADVSVWDQSEFVIYTVFDVVIMSVLTQMFFCGAMFAVLRQFGDPFAIFMTALTAGLLSQDFSEIPVNMMIGLVAAYGMVSSGTILTAISVSMVYKMYNLAILVIETDPTEKMPLTRNIFMIIMLFAGIIIFTVYWFACVRKKRNGIAGFSSEFTTWKRFVHSVKTFPYSAVALACLAYAAVGLAR
ncbi:MAG: CPBP family intramembrane metalloprotease [Ruminococcus sp.]|nr:CPBP family intramembrane metalloprotease [Ruminococcus sp.]